MILSGMMFALGVFVTGLLALGFCVALVRRTRRVAERRLMGAVSLRRSEFEAERDELRARHAIEVFRLEREIARVLDMATAHRLDADVKDRDLLSIQAELDGKDEEIDELQVRLEAQRQALQDIERKHAESSTSLRAARHALKLESRRRVAVEDTFDRAVVTADEKRIEISSLQAQMEALRQSLLQGEGPAVPGGLADDAAEQSTAVAQLPVPEMLRPVPSLPGDDDVGLYPSRPPPDAATPALLEPAVPDQATEEAALQVTSIRNGPSTEDPESLFVEALAEIRALKRAASAEAAE